MEQGVDSLQASGPVEGLELQPVELHEVRPSWLGEEGSVEEQHSEGQGVVPVVGSEEEELELGGDHWD